MLDEGMRAKISLNGSKFIDEMKSIIDIDWIPDV